MRSCRALVLGYYAAVLAVLGPLLLAGNAHRAPRTILKVESEVPKPPEATPIIDPPLAPEVVVVTPRGDTAGGLPAVATRERPRRPVPPVSPPALSRTGTLATHYRRWSPRTCWDSAGRHDLQVLTLYFTAIRDVPCGTWVIVTGPLGSVPALVWDHGPNCRCPERGLDLGDEVFAETVGPLRLGIGEVTWAAG